MPDPLAAPAPAVSAEAVAALTDPIFAQALEREAAPGLAFGVVFHGELVHARGMGVAALDGPVPTSDTTFRIASMTKSVTAAVLLSLRDDGFLSLDLPAVELVPELLAGGAEARLITLRHLLTMTAGLPTDDPWGDRQQDLPHAALRSLLASGLTPAWRPGERFEYSNLGYAILGLAIEAVTRLPYAEAAAMRVLRPVGMSSTGYHLDSLDESRRAQGYVRRSTGWAEEPWAGYGAFAPMGGLFSTVTDLTRWVGVMQDAHRSDAGSDAGAVLRPASLREMQTTQRLVAAVNIERAPDVVGYGFGLFEEFRSWGRTVHHSGGYPGFGSHMRWHPASGLGIVVLANGSYAPVYAPARDALQRLVTTLDVPQRRPLPDFPALDAAVAAVTAWLSAETADGDEADTLRAMFADNVERDVPWPERVVQWQALRVRGGAPPVEVAGTRRSPAPATRTWQVDGPAGRATVTVMLAPHDLHLVQSVTVRPGTGPGSDDEGAGADPDASTDWS